MPFGLTNAPAAFQTMMNHVLSDVLDVFAISLLDDIAVYSKTYKEHVAHVKTILKRLRKEKLYAKLSKCQFFASEIEFLGHMVSGDGIRMCSDKVGAIRDWPEPTKVKEMQAFLGLANYYRRFIPDFSNITLPMTALLKKDKVFLWAYPQSEAFKKLIDLFLKEPLLIHPDFKEPFVIECDASDFAMGAILSQLWKDGLLHPISYYSRKFNTAEINYEIYDKELMAIVDSLGHWRQFCLGSLHQIQIFTDHKNLVHFMTTKQLTRRQARWAMGLSEIDFLIHYRAGKKQGKPDALSRRTDFEIREGDPNFEGQFKAILRKEHFAAAVNGSNKFPITLRTMRVPEMEEEEVAQFRRLNHLGMMDKQDGDQDRDPTLRSAMTIRIRRIYARSAGTSDLGALYGIPIAILNDPLALEIKGKLLDKTGVEDEWSLENKVLLYNNRVYVPAGDSRVMLLQAHHDSVIAGHKGAIPTTELVSRNYWFPLMAKEIKAWVAQCAVCMRSKNTPRKPYGLLQPLPISTAPWSDLTQDFVVKLPVGDEGFDSILVVVCRMTKMAHFIACKEAIDAKGVAELMRMNFIEI
jgi:hypothetical protein